MTADATTYIHPAQCTLRNEPYMNNQVSAGVEAAISAERRQGYPRDLGITEIRRVLGWTRIRTATK